jgi:DNA-binding transcriptional MerR regulator/methylmalonyl-CoA mutase cobalamin-binding subunit
MTNDQSKGGAALAMNIAAVERDCGLSKDTLRVWERRYGFPAPLRDGHDERLYPADQVGKLRLLRRLIDAGHRPSKIVTRSVEELTALARPAAGGPAATESREVRDVLALLRAHRTERLREALAGQVLQHGLGAFAMDVAPDLAQAVGAAWSRGDLEIHQEHLFTEQLTAVLRSAINGVLNGRLSCDPPRVLLTTFPQEPHALGILMAEAVFVLQGCATVSLGARMPIPEIASAARAHEAQVVALSFSACMTSAQAHGGLAELRRTMDPAVQIWAGGSCPGLRARDGVSVLRSLADIAPGVLAWRQDAVPAANPNHLSA